MDWESQDDGFIAKLLVEDGAKDISVGTPVLVFVEDEVHCYFETKPWQASCPPSMHVLSACAERNITLTAWTQPNSR